jgi:predicted acylesterase/phospholipase RssA
MKPVICLSILLFIPTISVDSSKCRVLVLEGGGDRGAYHAGAFRQFVNALPAEEVAYDVITGISAGGLNAGALSLFKQGDEKNASHFLDNIWNNIA